MTQHARCAGLEAHADKLGQRWTWLERLQKQPTDSIKHHSPAYNQTSSCNHLSPASQACLFPTGEEIKRPKPEVATSAKSVRCYFLGSAAAEGCLTPPPTDRPTHGPEGEDIPAPPLLLLEHRHLEAPLSVH